MTKREREWIDRIVQLGCIICRLKYYAYVPAEVHHMLNGGRRIGNLSTLPLCVLHHRGGRNDDEVVSRDHSQRRFEARYGSESMLLERTRELIGWESTAT